MRLSLQLAWRYLRGKGTANAVPVLSRISMIAIAVSSCAMIILFSVFNGFGSLIDDLYKAFYPEIKITASKGKFFTPGHSFDSLFRQEDAIAATSLVLEDNVLVNTEEGETIPVILKGVDQHYFEVNEVQAYINKGVDSVMAVPVPTAIIGQHIAATLGIDVDNVFARMMVYYPNGDAKAGSLNPSDAFQSMILKPDGSFYVQEEFDTKYIIAPLQSVRGLMRQDVNVSSVEIAVKPGYSVEKLSARLQDKLGRQYVVATRYEQNRSVYMVMRSEKWAGYAILLFVLLIASFNMISALSLLVLEKQKDMGILRTMGMQPAMLSRVVLFEGVLWALVGGIIGLALGLLLCWAQIRYKLIRIPGAFIIDSYPVTVKITDILVVILTVSAVGLLAAIYPARRAARQKLHEIMAGK